MQFLEVLQSNPLVLVVLTGILGLMVGSFLNVVVYRLPVMMQRAWRQECLEFLEQPLEETPSEPFNLIKPDSRCPHCNHPISVLENIPILSFVCLKARCSACQQRISIRYPLVELATAVFSAYIAYQFGFSIFTAFALLLTWCLIALSLIDFDTQLLPDSITLPILWLGLLVSLMSISVSPKDAILGAIFGYLSLWSVYWLFKLITGKEGMGYGDFKLLAMLGAWLGWQMLPLVILLSAAVGAILGILMILVKGRDKNIPIPFGPYLAIAGWIALMWGDSLNRAYLGSVGL